MSNKTVKLTIDNQNFEFPVLKGTENEMGIDISTLRSKTAYITVDNGFGNTSSAESAITFLDGENGILRYRGIPIEQLAEKSNFLETSFLLIHGYLPDQSEYNAFVSEVNSHGTLDESLIKVIQAYPKDAHPMAILSSVCCGLSGVHSDVLDPKNISHVREATVRFLGQMPTICATIHRTKAGQPLVRPNQKLEYCENFFNMMFGEPGKDSTVPQEIIDALNLLLILHADHEQNCSTSTVRLVGSSAANIFASISGGVNALWGPLHGGANQAVIEMLQEIHREGGDVAKFVEMAKDKTSGFRLMGFGHRVYKNFDPRASIIKVACDKVLEKLGVQDPLLGIAKQLEAFALKDPYFKDKKLYPNVDFYSGTIYSALNIPVDMFTPMFALGRLPGWIAHWKEMNENASTRIGRPRQIYSGETCTNYVLIERRDGGKKNAA